ncbi:hypothetical protein MHH56_30310 [Paenibacillus sp. FSL K6-3182]
MLKDKNVQVFGLSILILQRESSIFSLKQGDIKILDAIWNSGE